MEFSCFATTTSSLNERGSLVCETVRCHAMIRALGLDLGTKTIGVAYSDELGLTAQPLTTIRREGLRRDIEMLRDIVNDRGATHLIIGLPLNMNGSEGPRAEATRRFGDQLTQQITLPLIYWDERLTTVAAERSLLEADVSRKKRREVIDQVAATLILQGWLDAQTPSR